MLRAEANGLLSLERLWRAQAVRPPEVDAVLATIDDVRERQGGPGSDERRREQSHRPCHRTAAAGLARNRAEVLAAAKASGLLAPRKDRRPAAGYWTVERDPAAPVGSRYRAAFVASGGEHASPEAAERAADQLNEMEMAGA